MTPAEKARELYDRFDDLGVNADNGRPGYDNAHRCALIAVDVAMTEANREGGLSSFGGKVYWNEVITEIKKL